MLVILLCLILPFLAGAQAAGQSPDTSRFNIPLPTLGGKQFWSDIALAGDWRVQVNSATGLCRVLDGSDMRRAWGDRKHCEMALDAARQERSLSFADKHLIILLHGLARPRSSMAGLAERLNTAGLQAVTVSYASTRLDLDVHATNLISLLDSLDGIDKVSFITHSFGGLVARTALARQDWPHHIKATDLVMMAPPSSGALLADRLRDFAPYEIIGGPAGEAITSDNAAAVPLPGIRHCIIAGGKGDDVGFNPYLPGDDDGLVRVEEAQLEGTDDFLLVPALHTFIMDEDVTYNAVQRFIEGGRCDEIQVED